VEEFAEQHALPFSRKAEKTYNSGRKTFTDCVNSPV
jgi:hypothetical protein